MAATSRESGTSLSTKQTTALRPTFLTVINTSSVDDPLHSDHEMRFIIVGQSYNHRLLVVVHAERGDRIRIISARVATPFEKRIYEKRSFAPSGATCQTAVKESCLTHVTDSCCRLLRELPKDARYPKFRIAANQQRSVLQLRNGMMSFAICPYMIYN